MDYLSKKKKSFWHSPIVLVILLVLLGIMAKELFVLAGKYKFSKEKHDIYFEELTELEEKKVNLEEDIESLETERGREEEIRDKFRVAKDGEEVIIVVPGEEE